MNISNIKTHKFVKIKNETHPVYSAGSYTAQEHPDEVYYKLFLDNNKVLLITEDFARMGIHIGVDKAFTENSHCADFMTSQSKRYIKMGEYYEQLKEIFHGNPTRNRWNIDYVNVRPCDCVGRDINNAIINADIFENLTDVTIGWFHENKNEPARHEDIRWEPNLIKLNQIELLKRPKIKLRHFVTDIKRLLRSYRDEFPSHSNEL